MATVPASIGLVVPLVTANASGVEAVRVDDGVDPAPADVEPRVVIGLGGAATLVGFPAGPARSGLASPTPLKTATAVTLTAATPVATPSGTAHLRRSGARLSSGSIFISSSSRVRRWFGRSRSEGAAGMPGMSFIVRPLPR